MNPCEDPDCHPCRVCVEQAKAVRTQALDAMRDLVDTIMVWHGVDLEGTWSIYRDHSPELRRWREFVAEHGTRART